MKTECAFALALVLSATACTTIYKFDRVEEPILPVSTFEIPRKPYEPYSLKFRLAVINFVDQTGAGGNLVKTIPDVLTTALYETSRFDLLDRGQLREKTVNELEKERQDMPVDGLLQGAITQIRSADKVIVCDLRVTNRMTNAVMYAKSAELRFTGSLEVTLNRESVLQLSREIADSFPRLDERQPARVVEISTNTVTISAGADRGIKTGMAALVQEKGDVTRDLETNEVLSNIVFVGQVSVISVMDRVSRATFEPGMNIRVGDTVVFK